MIHGLPFLLGGGFILWLLLCLKEYTNDEPFRETDVVMDIHEVEEETFLVKCINIALKCNFVALGAGFLLCVRFTFQKRINNLFKKSQTNPPRLVVDEKGDSAIENNVVDAKEIIAIKEEKKPIRPVSMQASKIPTVIKSNHSLLRQSISNHKMRSSSVDPEVKTQKATNGEDRRITDDYRAELAKLKETYAREHESLSKKLDAVSREKREISKQLAVALREKSKAKQDLEDTLSDKVSLLNQLEAAQRESKMSCKQQRATSKQIEEARKEINELRDQLKKYISEKTLLESRLKQVEQEYGRFRKDTALAMATLEMHTREEEENMLRKSMNEIEPFLRRLKTDDEKWIVADDMSNQCEFSPLVAGYTPGKSSCSRLSTSLVDLSEKGSNDTIDVATVQTRLLSLEKCVDALSEKRHKYQRTTRPAFIKESTPSANELEIDTGICNESSCPLEHIMCTNKECLNLKPNCIGQNLTDEQLQDLVHRKPSSHSSFSEDTPQKFMELKEFDIQKFLNEEPSETNLSTHEFEMIGDGSLSDRLGDGIVSGSPEFQEFLNKLAPASTTYIF